jgi:hypothetical protein
MDTEKKVIRRGDIFRDSKKEEWFRVIGILREGGETIFFTTIPRKTGDLKEEDDFHSIVTLTGLLKERYIPIGNFYEKENERRVLFSRD